MNLRGGEDIGDVDVVVPFVKGSVSEGVGGYKFGVYPEETRDWVWHCDGLVVYSKLFGKLGKEGFLNKSINFNRDINLRDPPRQVSCESVMHNVRAALDSLNCVQ